MKNDELLDAALSLRNAVCAVILAEEAAGTDTTGANSHWAKVSVCINAIDKAIDNAQGGEK